MRRAEEYHLPHTTSSCRLLTELELGQTVVEVESLPRQRHVSRHARDGRVRETVDHLGEIPTDPDGRGIEVLNVTVHTERVASLELGTHVLHEQGHRILADRHVELTRSR